jgi:D-lyxose ketol-isomerase
LFANPVYGNYHLQPASPCRNTGDDSYVQSGWLDIDGQARVQGTHVDMGSDESDGTTYATGPNVIVRVSPTGNDNNNGSSWALAKQTIGSALEAAIAQGGEVWVKQGTYYVNMHLPPYSYLYGGFAGTETTRSQRNWKTNPTILDGGNQSSVVEVYLAGHNLCQIDGFTIRNGNLNDKSLGTPYAEKFIMLKPGQRLPVHMHRTKTEDIINRGGGNFQIKLYNTGKDGMPDMYSPVTVYCDGIKKVYEAGETITITKGNSISLTPYMYHTFWAQEDTGDVLIGEVSSVNDDNTDNCFAEQVNRFTEIEEDELAVYPLCNEYN